MGLFVLWSLKLTTVIVQAHGLVCVKIPSHPGQKTTPGIPCQSVIIERPFWMRGIFKKSIENPVIFDLSPLDTMLFLNQTSH